VGCLGECGIIHLPRKTHVTELSEFRGAHLILKGRGKGGRKGGGGRNSMYFNKSMGVIVFPLYRRRKRREKTWGVVLGKREEKKEAGSLPNLLLTGGPFLSTGSIGKHSGCNKEKRKKEPIILIEKTSTRPFRTPAQSRDFKRGERGGEGK